MQRAMSILLMYLLVLATTPSFATSGAHFFPDTSASVDSSGELVIFIDEGGVGQQEVNYSINWTASATYECFNGGGNHPKATNKATISAGGSASAQFNPTNGRVEQSYTIPGTPPGPGSFSCPSGQSLVFANASYSATIVDTTNNASSKTLTASGGPF